MVPLLSNAARPKLSICARCAFRASETPRQLRKSPKSGVSRKWFTKVATETPRNPPDIPEVTNSPYTPKVTEAEQIWAAQAEEIKAGRQKSMFKKLEERGYIHAVTGSREEADRMLTENPLGAYVGVDPTASSLHVGHMLPLMSLFWLYVHGYPVVTLIGGATARIGDPSGRLKTRTAADEQVTLDNFESMYKQMQELWLNVETYSRKYGYIKTSSWKRNLLNNGSWWNKLPMIDVLRILGPGFRIGSMLARDTVKKKMEEGDGMSFAEFTYPILQGWDWWEMYRSRKIQIQIGGSDQFGNITAGLDAVKYIEATYPQERTREIVAKRGTPFGFTVPLLTTSSGQKFGKSAGNAIWLDRKLTSSFDLYKFFLGTSDADVGRYLKLFTFMPIEEIDALVEEHMKSPPQRKAQHRLAKDFVEFVHGPTESAKAETEHRIIFAKSTTSIEDAITELTTSLPTPDASASQPSAHLKLPRSALRNLSPAKLLVACELVPYGTVARRMIADGAIYVGKQNEGGELIFQPLTMWKREDQISRMHLIADRLLILRRGKTNVKIIEVMSDADYDDLGLTYPGSTDNEVKDKGREESEAIP